MRKIIVITTLVIGSALAASFYWPEKAEADSFRSIAATPFLIERVKQDEWLLLDVRTPEEYADGHIPGAVNIPHDQINDYLDQLNDAKDKPIIIYCRSGRRATLAMQMLEQKEFTDVSHLEGDMMGWTSAGLPVDIM